MIHQILKDPMRKIKDPMEFFIGKKIIFLTKNI